MILKRTRLNLQSKPSTQNHDQIHLLDLDTFCRQSTSVYNCHLSLCLSIVRERLLLSANGQTAVPMKMSKEVIWGIHMQNGARSRANHYAKS